MSDPIKPPRAPVAKPTPEQKFAAKGQPSNVEDANARLRKRVKKPKKFPTRPVAVRLQVRLWEGIDALAERFEVDRTAVVKRAFEELLRKYGTHEELEAAGVESAAKPNPFDAFAQMHAYDDPSPFAGYQQPNALMFPVERSASPVFPTYAAPIPPPTNVRTLPGVVLPQGGGDLPYQPPIEQEEAAGE